jgi:hypothetical protein
MTLFELVKAALDELYEQGKAQYGKDLDDAIKTQMGYLSGAYSKLNDASRKAISYRDPATRFAYVYKYVATHGDYVVQLMERLRAELNQPIFRSRLARVSCVGGGPGSDIIAVLKYLAENNTEEKVEKLTCYLLDREQAWADTWTELDESLEIDLSLNVNFQALDVTEPDSWEFQKKFLQADLYTMSYFVSEVHALDKKGVVTKFWEKLFAEAKPGAIFLYDDNGHDLFNNYIDERAAKAKLKVLLSDNNVRWTPRYSEQASELGEFRQKFGQQPKLQGYLSYRAFVKE